MKIFPIPQEIKKLRASLEACMQLLSCKKDSRFYKHTLKSYALIEMLIAGLKSKAIKELKRKDVDLDSRAIRGSTLHERAAQIMAEYFAINAFHTDDLIFPMAQQNVISRNVKRWITIAKINPEIHAHDLGRCKT